MATPNTYVFRDGPENTNFGPERIGEILVRRCGVAAE